jgi:hypothetical protein
LLYLGKLIVGFLHSSDIGDRDFWLALSFAKQIITRNQLKKAIEARITSIKWHLESDFSCRCEEMIKEKKIPIIHRYLVRNGDRHFQSELQTLQELLEQMYDKEYDDFFKE